MATKTKRKPEKVTSYQIVVRLPADLGDTLKKQAEKEDRPISRVVRSAVLMYLQQPSLLTDAKP